MNGTGANRHRVARECLVPEALIVSKCPNTEDATMNAKKWIANLDGMLMTAVENRTISFGAVKI